MGSEKNDGTSVPPSETKLCANGCGFFGTAANMNLCSKCYRDLRVKEEQAASAKAVMEKTLSVKSNQQDGNSAQSAVVAVSSDSSSSSSEAAAAAALGSTSEPVVATVHKVANRCFSCNKKVGLTGFNCKCGSTFCGAHRYPEDHSCTFDFKGAGRNAIAKANPAVKADKVNRI